MFRYNIRAACSSFLGKLTLFDQHIHKLHENIRRCSYTNAAYASMLQCWTYSASQHRAEDSSSTLLALLAPFETLSIVGWKIKTDVVCVSYTNAKHEAVEKKPNPFAYVLCCLKYDSSVYLTDFYISVRSEYSARSAAVRAFRRIF